MGFAPYLQEVLLENQAEFARDTRIKTTGTHHEPYDRILPAITIVGSVADGIMAEFWSKRFGFDSITRSSRPPPCPCERGRGGGAEVFTSDNNQAWQQYPWSMKDQSDWALAMGVNRFTYHTFAHKPLGEDFRPGMTMGPYGVHWDRGQTWWPMVGEYHKYISRCSHLMQQGQAVSDILYLTPEGAPMIFNPPAGALN